jgi:hypothetical protein
VQQIQQLKL